MVRNTDTEDEYNAEEDDAFQRAVTNTEPLSEIGNALVEWSVKQTAADCGRTPEEQWKRMGDRFAYEDAEMDDRQKQLDDYELSAPTVEVTR